MIQDLFDKVLKDEPNNKEDLVPSANLKQSGIQPPPSPKVVKSDPKLAPFDHFKKLSQDLKKKGTLSKKDLTQCLKYAKQFFHNQDGLNKVFLHHTVTSGEYLSTIARKYNITASRIAEFNPGLDPNRIFPGQKIKIVRGPNHILIRKSDYQMFLFIQGVLFEQYTIGIGREGKATPIMTTKLSNSRAKNPDYTHPETKITYPFGHPENPIGTRWMGFEGDQGLGIHGTDDESSIGKAMSSGCIRMKQVDLEHVYNLLFIGDSVEIKP